MSYRNFNDLHTQVGQDVIENGVGTGCGGGCGSKTVNKAIDAIQFLLWDEGIRIDVKSLDVENITIVLTGEYADFLVAKKFLSEKKPGYKITFEACKW
ncbi:MAG: hypothetical protein WBD81_17950 [Collimonas pratensis]|uniref:hypothetical protein n=1 Tax=Collimonas pratensis TaxID=279113 RepID=UPI003C721DA9